MIGRKFTTSYTHPSKRLELTGEIQEREKNEIIFWLGCFKSTTKID
jgi:hypothetical protein